MKKIIFSMLVTLLSAGMTYASIESETASLPEPSTVLICAGGLAFFFLTVKKAK